ncbi:hypothetical protein PAPYR_4920 [Paratrimastix pyriformis]|uniref:Uncharacterized protein n=1 Tax=Paratrimastix pyriformis TaxID=342808 RepID=A0ABQ8UN39_9EUKA|nr:hypothetical protein PAPYR_4920 [Paratrimastix pyriformis]
MTYLTFFGYVFISSGPPAVVMYNLWRHATKVSVTVSLASSFFWALTLFPIAGFSLLFPDNIIRQTFLIPFQLMVQETTRWLFWYLFGMLKRRLPIGQNMSLPGPRHTYLLHALAQGTSWALVSSLLNCFSLAVSEFGPGTYYAGLQEPPQLLIVALSTLAGSLLHMAVGTLSFLWFYRMGPVGTVATVFVMALVRLPVSLLPLLMAWYPALWGLVEGLVVGYGALACLLTYLVAKRWMK